MSKRIAFTKSEALGNDFIIVDDRAGELALTAEDVERMCDRHFGIGADGLIILRASREADLAMTHHNPDGSVAEVCGNGLRCVAKYAYDRRLVGRHIVYVETGSGVREVELHFEEGLVASARVGMGKPAFETDGIPMTVDESTFIDRPLRLRDSSITATCLSVGNPHCVVLVEDVELTPVARLGAEIERLKVFPRRTNVEFAEIVSPREVKLRVWERGVGETLACGSGACAATVALSTLGHVRRHTRVHLPGGMLRVEWRPEEQVFLDGPVSEVFRGEIELGEDDVKHR